MSTTTSSLPEWRYCRRAPEQADGSDRPCLPVATTAKALDLIIHTSLTTSTDLRTTAGALH